jgi:hypothetical protein
MKRPLFLPLFLLLICTLFAGCGQVKVTGTVTFSDGEPLSKGKIVFENDKNKFTAVLHNDGTFNLGMLKDGQGIPPGKYSVAVAEAFDEEFYDPDKPPRVTHFIAKKFRSSKTSGLEFDIQKRTTGISIIVEKPETQQPSTRKN